MAGLGQPLPPGLAGSSLHSTRRQQRNVRDLPKNTEPSLYPEYYLQNFHHQTDGYLSDHSAELYDLQVEILFNGTADAMRRRVIAPLKRGLRHFNDRAPASLRILDIATGTGRTLHQIRRALPPPLSSRVRICPRPISAKPTVG